MKYVVKKFLTSVITLSIVINSFYILSYGNVMNSLTYKGNIYKFIDKEMTWGEAKVYCEKQGGHLATVTSEKEWEIIHNAVMTNQKHYWLGGTDVENEGEWKWVTGEAWTFEGWCDNEPNNDYDGTEDYLGTYTNTYQWNDYRNNEKQNFICEFEKKDVQNTNDISIFINGKNLVCDIKPYIENGTTRVPMRVIFEALGAEVDYDTDTKTITVRKGSKIIKLVTGASTATINGREMTLTAPVENKNSSTMVPLRFVSEALGAEVNWNYDTRTITINLAEDKADKEHLVNNPITGHSNVILTIYDNRNNILDGIMWTAANWADGAKHIINIEEEVPDVEQGKGVLASILANVPEIESEPVDTSKYTDISELASDGVSIVEDYFGTSTKETKLLQNSIEKLGDVIDWTAFSIEEIDFLLRDYKKNIQYFVLLQSNCDDEYVNGVIDGLMQDYTDKWYKTIIDINEKIADEAVDKGIDVSAGFYTAGIYPVVKYSSELISTTTGLKDKTEALANFYQVCRMINPVDKTLEKYRIKYNNGECTESELQAAFELNKAVKIYAYECITKFGNLSDIDKAYVNIQDIKQYILKDGEIIYLGGAGGSSMGGR